MTNLENYLVDGACAQARAVLAMLQPFYLDRGDEKYYGEIYVARWENCREQGYVVSMNTINNKCINIAFFEHRNSDGLCAVKWEQRSLNSPTITTALPYMEKQGVYQTKSDVSYRVGYGEIMEMVKWIKNELQTFYDENKEKEFEE
jgi:hypothetical protein